MKNNTLAFTEGSRRPISRSHKGGGGGRFEGIYLENPPARPACWHRCRAY